MLCQKCKKNEASIHFKGVFNDNVVKLVLCEECAKTTGLMMSFGQGQSGVELNAFGFPWEKHGASLADWISALTDVAGQPEPVAPKRVTLKCDSCGLTYTAFKESGRLGCDNCYTAFASYLGPLLKRIHGSDYHAGKAYEPLKKSSPASAAMKNAAKTIEQLKRELQNAVLAEEYERAAQLRDEIKKLGTAKE